VAGTRLTVEDRIRIETLWLAGRGIPQIAVAIGRHRSTVWRELERNRTGWRSGRNPLGARWDRSGRLGLYRCGYLAGRAQQKADRRARRPRRPRLGGGQPARPLVVAMLARRWSPQQIAAWLRRAHPDRPELQVSHETIYQALYVQSRGNLRAELGRQQALRSGRTRRRARPRAAGAVRSSRPWTLGEWHISNRPAEAADRAVPGHWEGDLLIGARGASAIITLVERSTRYALLGALPDGRTSAQVIPVLATLIGRLPDQLRRSLTWDCGPEMSRHAAFRVAADCPVYFCDPHAPWQRGSNENTNRLLRDYFPRSATNFHKISQPDLDAVADELNTRPRNTLNWQTPAEALNTLLVATAD
jgi:transposase, IS30 family